MPHRRTSFKEIFKVFISGDLEGDVPERDFSAKSIDNQELNKNIQGIGVAVKKVFFPISNKRVLYI